jgi:hypothetical protein
MTYTEAQKFQTAYDNIKTNHFPISLAYKLMRLNATAVDCIKFFETQYAQIISEYALRGADGQYVQTEDGSLKIIPEKIQEAGQRIAELEAFDVEVPSDQFLILDDLKEINDCAQLTLEDLEIFMVFTKNEKPTE